MNNYQTPYIPQQQQYTPQPQMQFNNRIYVKGEDEVRGYLVQKGTEQVLWDSSVPVIYIKSVDAFGNVKLTTLDYTIRPTVEEVKANETQALREEVNDLRKELRSFMEQIQQQQNNNKNYKSSYNGKKGDQS